MYYVLLVLRTEKCGTEIMETVAQLTNQRIILGPGTLYTILSQFEEEKIINETKVDGRKRSYLISKEGNRLLFNEYERLHQMIADTKSYLGKNNEI